MAGILSEIQLGPFWPRFKGKTGNWVWAALLNLNSLITLSLWIGIYDHSDLPLPIKIRQNSYRPGSFGKFWGGWGPQTILGHHHYHHHHDGGEASVMPFERGRMRCNNGVMFQTGHQPQGHTVMMTKIYCSMIMMIIMMMVMNMMTKDDNKYD